MQRPKRRRYKDNPYRLEIDNVCKVYIVSFKDSRGIIQKVEISEEIFNALDKFELEDLSEMNEYDNHIEHSEIFENNLNSRAINKSISLEDEVINKCAFEELKKAIDKLPNVQKRRIKKYYFQEKTEREIAEEENATQQSVHIVLKRALENLKKILKK